MFEDLAQVAEDFGALKHVRLTEFEPGWVTAIGLGFESGVLTIEADGSHDTIRWHVGHAADPIDADDSAWPSMLSSRAMGLGSHQPPRISRCPSDRVFTRRAVDARPVLCRGIASVDLST